MQRLTFRKQGARQATKEDLCDILAALDPSAAVINQARISVDELRLCIKAAINTIADRERNAAERCIETPVDSPELPRLRAKHVRAMDGVDRAYAARDHMEDLISKPGGAK